MGKEIALKIADCVLIFIRYLSKQQNHNVYSKVNGIVVISVLRVIRYCPIYRILS